MYHIPIIISNNLVQELSILHRSPGSYYYLEDLHALIVLPERHLQSLCREIISYDAVYYTILDCISGCADAHTQLTSQEKINFRKMLEKIFSYVSQFHKQYLTQEYWLAFLNTCLSDENMTAPLLNAILNASLAVEAGLMRELGDNCAQRSSLKQLKEAICAFIQHRCSVQLPISFSESGFLTTTTILENLVNGSQDVRRLTDNQLQTSTQIPVQYDSQFIPSPLLFPRNPQGRIILPPLTQPRVEPVSQGAFMHVRRGPC